MGKTSEEENDTEVFRFVIGLLTRDPSSEPGNVCVCINTDPSPGLSCRQRNLETIAKNSFRVV